MADKQVTDNDALGGAGSVRSSVLAVALGGLSRAIDGAVSRKYPLTYFNEADAINAEGQRVPGSAPGKSPTVAESARSALANPLVIGVAVAVVASVAIVWALRK